MSGSFLSPYATQDDKQTPTNITEWQRQVRDQITGQLTKSVAGNTDKSLTTDESYKHILIFTGALTGSINIIVANLTKQWIVTNNTSGAFTLTVKTSGGSGVTIAQGKSATLYGNGTNVVRATADV